MSSSVSSEAPKTSEALTACEAPGARLEDKIKTWQTTLYLAQLRNKAAEVTGLPWEDFLAYREFSLSKPRYRETTLLLQSGEKKMAGHLPWSTWHQLQEFAMIMGDDIRPRCEVPRETAAVTTPPVAETAQAAPPDPEGPAVVVEAPPRSRDGSGGSS